MDERQTYTLVLSDGTEVDFVYDDAGNYIVKDSTVIEKFTGRNLESMKLMLSGVLVQNMEPMVLRGHCVNPDGTATAYINAKTAEEKLREDNDLLTECILEMSEIIYDE